MVASVEKPSFLAIGPGSRVLYAVSELKSWNGEYGGAIAAWEILSANGTLRPINILSSSGDRPCHIALDSHGRIAAVAHYGDGSVATFRLLKDGAIGPRLNFFRVGGTSINKERQTSAHAHGCFFSPDDRLMIAPDLGADRLYLYQTNATSSQQSLEPLSWVAAVPGAGPRHFVFHPACPFGYVVNELASTITRYSLRSNGKQLVPHETISTLDAQFSGDNLAAAIAIDRMGRFLYCSNRGADELVVFSVGHDGILRLIQRIACGGKTPRHFALDPTQRFVAVCNQDSDRIVVLRRDATSGNLSPTGMQMDIASPTCIVFVPHSASEAENRHLDHLRT